MIYPLVGGVDVSDEGIKERASRDEVLMHGIARDARFEGGQSAKDHSFLSVQRLLLFRPPPIFTPGRRDSRSCIVASDCRVVVTWRLPRYRPSDLQWSARRRPRGSIAALVLRGRCPLELFRPDGGQCWKRRA